jgi:RsiW-degrading membrane proteinase PrsW (M82 family)
MSTKTSTLALVLPVRAWLHAAALRRSAILAFAGFVGYPLLAGWLVSQQFRPIPVEDGQIGPAGLAALAHDLKWLDWPFVAYFGAAWLVALWLVVRPTLTARPLVTVAIGALVTGAPIAIWLETKLDARTNDLVSSILAVGGSEELAKTVPVLAAIPIMTSLYQRRAHEILDLSPRAFLYLGCVSGTVFGCSEAVEYIVGSQNSTIFGDGSALSLTETVFLRLITDPINHAIWAGTTGFFVGLAVLRARRAKRAGIGGVLEQSWLIGIGLLITATLHGLHDFAGNPAVDAVIDTASALLLLGYALAGEQVEQAVLALPGPRWGTRPAAPQVHAQPLVHGWAPPPPWWQPAGSPGPR